jgi:hypothetical protein
MRTERLHRWMPPALLILAIAGLIACAAFGAPLVAILVAGLLLVVPLLTWGPVRTARHPEERSGT